MIESTVVERPFLLLLGDAIKLLLLAETQDTRTEDEGLFVRSSVIHSVFTLEAAANCCLREHHYPKRVLERCDTMPLLEKFEFVLATVHAGQSIDRGAKVVQLVDELVSIRNRYVHPKAKLGPLIEDAMGEGLIAIEAGSFPVTSLAYRPVCWKAEDARLVLKAAIDFLDVFFVDLCKFSPERIERLLVSSATFNTSLMGHSEGKGFGLMCDLRVPELLSEANLSTRFIDFNRWR